MKTCLRPFGYPARWTRHTAKYLYLLLLLAGSLTFSSCALKPVCKHRNITYDAGNNLQLDLYTPRKLKSPRQVLVFVHGGNWIHGKKSIYRFFGKGLARKGIAAAIVNYRLCPKADYKGMAHDVAGAVKWLRDSSGRFGVDTSQIFISGHSAGAQIAALIATDDDYFKQTGISRNPIKGVVLIDAFGLDMYRYFSLSENPGDTLYKRVFSGDTVTWKKASPAHHLSRHMPPFLLFVGGKTYPVIKQINNEFYAQLTRYQPEAQFIIVKRRHHVAMIFQFLNPHIKAYRQILEFIQSGNAGTKASASRQASG